MANEHIDPDAMRMRGPVITIPVSGWYRLAGDGSLRRFEAGKAIPAAATEIYHSSGGTLQPRGAISPDVTWIKLPD